MQDRTHADDAIDGTTGNGRIVTADRPGTVHTSPAVDMRYLAAHWKGTTNKLAACL